MGKYETPARLRAVLADVERFRAAFEAWASLHVWVQKNSNGAGEYEVRDGVPSGALSRARRDVAVAAGRAGLAASIVMDSPFYDSNGWNADQNLIHRWQAVAYNTRIEEILDYTDMLAGQIAALVQNAEHDTPPQLGPTELHALIWGAAKKLWQIGEYRRAVSSAADAVEWYGRQQTSRHDIEGVVVWQEAFSDKAPEPGRPRLRWPGDPKHKSVTSMNRGLLGFGVGVQQTIRNQAAHGQGEQEYTPQEALERLGALSLLARWIDECNLDEASPAVPAPTNGQPVATA
ncbi:TIGR02391 family protein [Nocardia sp. NPDC059195]|uniref:TIGR02391 family protein n=1 Tax=Nocardia sp. NPDC059195 TaxID=3346765 RepID=UPI003693EDCD